MYYCVIQDADKPKAERFDVRGFGTPGEAVAFRDGIGYANDSALCAAAYRADSDRAALRMFNDGADQVDDGEADVGRANALAHEVAGLAERYRDRQATAHELDAAIDKWREG